MPSDGSFVCPAIDKNLLPHEIYKMVHNKKATAINYWIQDK
jgi:hypothetical protein